MLKASFSRSILGLLAATTLLTMLAACNGKPTGPDTGTQPGSNWWTFQADLANSGRLPGVGLGTPLEIAWERELISTDIARNYMSSPVFGSGKVLVHHGLNPGVLYALSIADGSTLWSFSAPANAGETKVTLRESPAVANGEVYGIYSVQPQSGVHTSRLYALAENDGSVQWSTNVAGAAHGSVKVAGGQIYAIVGGHQLHAFRQNDGGLSWTATLGEGQHTAYNTPAVAFGNVIAADTDGVYAFSMGTGSPSWSYTFSEPLWPYSPVVYMDVAVGEPAVLVVAGTELAAQPNQPAKVIIHGLNPANGVELWRVELVLDYTNNSQTVIATDHKAFLLAGEHILAFDVVTGVLDLTTIHQAPRRLHFPPAVSGGILFYTTGAELRAISVANGSLLWETTLSDQWLSSEEGLAINQGLLIVPNRSRVIAYRPVP